LNCAFCGHTQKQHKAPLTFTHHHDEGKALKSPRIVETSALTSCTVALCCCVRFVEPGPDAEQLCAWNRLPRPQVNEIGTKR
jgi:hypothetical protein